MSTETTKKIQNPAQQNTPHQPQPEPTFKRREDQIRIGEIGKLTSAVKGLIVVILLLLWYFNSENKDTKKLIEYQMRMVDDLNQKIEQKILRERSNSENVTFSQSNVFTISPNAAKCATCHNNERNPLYISTTWKLDDFKDYVRGKVRIPSNLIMPNYTDKEISDKELEKIYLEILKNKNFK